MAGPISHVFPMVCPITGDEINWVTPFSSIVRAVTERPGCDEEERKTMLKQAFYMRAVVQETLVKQDAVRCGSGSCKGAYVWFPFVLEHAVLNVPTFDRIIHAFIAFRDGLEDKASEIACDVVRGV